MNRRMELSRPSYHYAPLDNSSHEIRLLQILPCLDPSAPVRCILQTFKLHDVKQSFIALSYCWGQLSEDHVVWIDDCPLTVTANIAKAFIQIRKLITSGSLSKGASQLFWADCICIDQKNDQEKAPQVNLMSQIYASATHVLSWLGSDNESVSHAFTFMANVNEAQKSPNRHKTTICSEQKSENEMHGGETPSNELMENVLDPRLAYLLKLSESVIEFFSLEYWHRVWIVQEIVLTDPEKHVLVHGEDIMTFCHVQSFRDGWLRFLRDLDSNKEWQEAISRHPQWQDRAKSWPAYLHRMEEALVVWSYYDFMRGISSDSLFFIVLGSAYQASDLRDLVYGFQGLSTSVRLRTDYTKPASDVFQAWFVTVLEDWKDFQPLYFSGFAPHGMPDLPSWVPDLSSERTNSPVWDATLARTIETGTQQMQFNLGSLDHRDFPTIKSGKYLLAQGIWLDSVEQCVLLEPGKVGANVSIFFSAVDLQERYVTGLTNLHVLFRVLLCGLNRFDSAHSPSLGSDDQGDTTAMTGIQFFRNMPLLRSVAPLLLSKGDLSLAKLDDVVVRSFCTGYVALGSDLQADFHLAAAFVLLLTTGHEASSSPFRDLLRGFGLPPTSDFNRAFIDCFFPRYAHLFDNVEMETMFQSMEVANLLKQFNQYIQVYSMALFKTTDGYLGNGPQTMQQGDRVAVLDGAAMPFVLRPQGGEFMLIGPCYMEGLSNGEPAAMARDGRMPVADIILV